VNGLRENLLKNSLFFSGSKTSPYISPERSTIFTIPSLQIPGVSDEYEVDCAL
jgi:hypothetical protein